ncbi:MAG: GHKL domain-containing protein [Ruminococcaceae bacterium]|nr:GHKL domain-containing protein [Oscillospiraceae bacterium]
MRAYLTSLLSWFIVLSAAALCIAPMRHRLRHGPVGTLWRAAALFAVVLPVLAFVETRFDLPYNATLLPMLLLAYAAYRSGVRAQGYQCLGAFAFVCALMSFVANVANGFDAILHPSSTLNDFSLEAAAFEAALAFAVAALAYYPLRRYGAYIVDNFDVSPVWYITVAMDAVFLTFNLLITPQKYENMHVGRVFMIYWLVLALMFALLLLLCVVFYSIVKAMMLSAETQERNRILELQESQFLTQQRYMEATARERHDFRHTIDVISELAEAGDYAELRKYIKAYASSLSENELRRYCDNRAVNALVNHYAQMAKQESIELNVSIRMPERVGVSEVDLCGILGNMLENAMLACRELPEDRRRVSLTMTLRAGGALYIVVMNSFNGVTNQHNGRYLSTRHRGSGVGLDSVAATAERYDGMAEFRHEDGVFYSDVMLRTRPTGTAAEA